MATLLIAVACRSKKTTVFPSYVSCSQRLSYNANLFFAKGNLPVPSNPTDALTPTPPMGVNPYNSVGTAISETIVHQFVQAMQRTCMAEAGYTIFTLDDGWQAAQRDSQGNLYGDPIKFPSGMKAIGDFLHGNGLRFGLYTSVGGQSCDHLPGSLQHELQDAKTFAQWGVDFLKVDWCPPGNDYSFDGAGALAKTWHNAITASGRPMILSVSTGGGGNPWQWPDGLVNMWRIGADVIPKYAGAEGSLLYLINQSHLQESLVGVGPGHWSDMDMLEVGNAGLSLIEAQTAMSMAAIVASPLFAGNDLRTMSADIQYLLTNPEVLAVDQDPLGKPGQKVADQDGKQIWVKPMAKPGTVAAMLFNSTDTAQSMSVRLDQVGLQGTVRVRDLWQRKDIGVRNKQFSTKVPAHGTVLLLLSVQQ